MIAAQNKNQVMTKEVQEVLTESYNNVLNSAKKNRAEDNMDNVTVGDPRIDSLFEPVQKGKRYTQGQVMKSYNHGKNYTPIMHGKGMTLYDEHTNVERSTMKTLDLMVQAQRKNNLSVSPVSAQVANIETVFGNKKNYSQLNTNYSFKIQLQRQIQKAKKHQPNVSLNKLIDLGEFEANTKISKDNLLKNVAFNFKQARARMRGENVERDMSAIKS